MLSILIASLSITPMSATFGFENLQGWKRCIKCFFLFERSEELKQKKKQMQKQKKQMQGDLKKTTSPKLITKNKIMAKENKRKKIKYVRNEIGINLEKVVSVCWLSTLVGCWVGAIPIPLDWGEQWQNWPFTCYFGSLFGYSLGLLLFLIIKLFSLVFRNTKKKQD
ncbi:phosphatidylinositol-glycan biosynthesis class f protein-related [Anaeramoeba flamelloides]|uniref:Phosphatidylinositol-glycan biosynthesis class f protein-related n=1 Tax=Anaeramoeba flamelloides TaxID=1746091 RepID=A0ABQ8XQU0_9EUKA|nr:phosphatidylinositol-glycan biosynthesis class f protein-related [Anaeramoeba flamelloides]